MDYAKQVGQYADYALFRAAIESRDPKVTIELAEALQQRSPESEYGVKAARAAVPGLPAGGRER